jgi:L-threonylcarbamoyladenylate synthase
MSVNRDSPTMYSWHLRQAARTLKRGGIVAYPTEGVWGLGCDPANPDTLARLLALKRRPTGKGLILIASDFRQLTPWLAPLDSANEQRAFATWPGPVTWLWPAGPAAPALLRGSHDTLAVRVTDHPLAGALCARFGGPLVSTSANLAGRRPARNALQARLRLGGRFDILLPGATGGRTQPTEIRDARTGAIIRPGA